MPVSISEIVVIPPPADILMYVPEYCLQIDEHLRKPWAFEENVRYIQVDSSQNRGVDVRFNFTSIEKEAQAIVDIYTKLGWYVLVVSGFSFNFSRIPRPTWPGYTPTEELSRC